MSLQETNSDVLTNPVHWAIEFLCQNTVEKADQECAGDRSINIPATTENDHREDRHRDRKLKVTWVDVLEIGRVHGTCESGERGSQRKCPEFRCDQIHAHACG